MRSGNLWRSFVTMLGVFAAAACCGKYSRQLADIAGSGSVNTLRLHLLACEISTRSRVFLASIKAAVSSRWIAKLNLYQQGVVVKIEPRFRHRPRGCFKSLVVTMPD